MRGRMPVNLQRLRILVRKQAQVGVLLEGAGQVNKIAIGLCGQRRIRQPRTDRFGNIERGGALGNFLGAPVGELDTDTLRHRWIKPCIPLNLFSLREWKSEGQTSGANSN